ncbi:MAG: DUF924 family protein [Steroidobacteraceae bacterium]
MDHARSLLDFWFGARPMAPAAVRQRMAFWFGGDAPELTEMRDRDLESRYAPLMRRALAGELSAWADSPRRRLALILLLDQLPRNVFRGTAEAFAGDAAALVLTQQGIEQAADAALDPLERLFFYMPLQHAESVDVQEQSVAIFGRLAGEVPEALQGIFDGVAGYALRHRDIIRRFGRFPHRNAALGRVSTEEERLWLARSGERFGQ